MAQPLLSGHQIGEVIDFTQERLGRLCNQFGDKVAECPHCKRRGMYRNTMTGKVQYVHIGRVGELRLEALDACTMFPRAEFKLKYGADSIHPRFRRPGDEDMSVEEVRR